MTERSRLKVAVIALALLLSGCGGASASSRTTTTTRSTSTPAAIASTTHSAAPTATKPPKKRHKAAVKTSATSTTTATVQTAPSPPPSGTPPAPDGLAATTGYATYELCSGQCSGTVPATLRRALHLPHIAGGSCPVSGGSGPVRPLGSLRVALTPFIGSPWKAARVTWVSARSYTGPVLIRGRRLSGPGAVGFGEGRIPYDELQLLASGMDAPSVPGEGRVWLSFTRARAPGCFAYQVDGTSFSSVIVFETA